MPLPRPGESESEKDFIGRCMKALSGEFEDNAQRSAVCYKQWRGKSKDMAYDLKDVEIFKPGTWNGKKYTEQDIDDLVDSFGKVGYEPPIKLGHEEKSGDQAWGWVKNLRKVSGRAVADLTDIPEQLYNAIKDRRYNALSSEIFFDLKRDGNLFRRALKAVAILGAEIPAVSGLKPLEASLSETDSFSEIVNVNVEVIDMDELKKLTEENQKLAAQLAELEKRKDLTSDVEKLTQQISDKEAAITKAADRIAALETKLRDAKVADKVAKLSLPAVRDQFEALYRYSQLDQVVKFGEGEKTLEAVLDSLVAQLNASAKALFTEDGAGGNGKLDERADVKLARLVDEYIEKHNLDASIESHQKARAAVFAANQDLAQAYIQS